MRLVDGIDIERDYRIEEIMDMYYKGLLRRVAVHGYVVQADAEGWVRFIPWWEKASLRMETGTTRVTDITPEMDQLAHDVEEQHPMRRTSPQEKVARLALRIMAEAKRNGGTVPGLTDDQVHEITGEAWKTGENHITMEAVRRIAAHFLGVGEETNREADRHLASRAHPLA